MPNDSYTSIPVNNPSDGSQTQYGGIYIGPVTPGLPSYTPAEPEPEPQTPAQSEE